MTDAGRVCWVLVVRMALDRTGSVWRSPHTVIHFLQTSDFVVFLPPPLQRVLVNARPVLIAGLNSMAGSGSSGQLGSYGNSGSGVAGSGPGSGAAAGSNAWVMHGSGSGSMAPSGQGPGKWGLLAQYQGSYGPMYALGGYGGGYGHAGGYGAHHHPHHMGTPAKQLLSAQFMPEGLRQQLQQSNYLTQLQVSSSGCCAVVYGDCGGLVAVMYLAERAFDQCSMFGAM
jgi:hypothetical protein